MAVPKKPHVHLAAGLGSQQHEGILGMWQFGVCREGSHDGF